MTVAALERVREYVENGVTTVFAIPFEFLEASEVQVVRRSAAGVETVLALNSAYSISGGNGGTGSVTMIGGALNGQTLIVRGATRIRQPTEYETGDNFPAASHERALDRLTMIAQETRDAVGEVSGRALLVKRGQAGQELDRDAFRGKFIAGDGAGNFVPASGTGNDAALRADLANPAAGSALVAFSVGRSAKQKLERVMSLVDAQVGSGTSSDNTLLAELLADGYRRIHLDANLGQSNDILGAYNITAEPWTNPEAGGDFDLLNESPGNLVGGLILSGDGMGRTKIDQGSGNYALMYNSRSADPNDSMDGLIVRDLTIEGRVVEDGFDNNIHNVALFGVRNALFKRVMFKGFRGDGCWPSNGPKPTTTRYNENINFLRCIFDGVNNDTRNGISFESCNGFSVELCRFIRIARGDAASVGCIDIEPFQNIAGWVMKNGIISRNIFEDYLGAAIAYFVVPNRYTDPARGWIASNNIMARGTIGIDCVGADTAEEVATAVHRMSVMAHHNLMTEVRNPLRTAGATGVSFKHNDLTDCDSILLGTSGDPISRPSKEIEVKHNKFLRCGKINGPVVVQDQTTLDCAIEDNDAIDCGREDGLAGWFFLARDGEVNTRVNRNRVNNENGKMKAFAQIGDATVGARAQKIGNEIVGVPMTAADNFSPPAPQLGASGSEVLLVDRVIAAGGHTFFDITVPGASDGAYRAWLSGGIGPDDVIKVSAILREAQVVRVILENLRTTATFTVEAGTVVNVVEAV